MSAQQQDAIAQCRAEQRLAAAALVARPDDASYQQWLEDWVIEEILIMREAAQDVV